MTETDPARSGGHAEQAEALTALMGGETTAVAVTFCGTVPDGVPTLRRREASSCSYWRRAAQGETFATTNADHLGCPIGAVTHGAEVPAETAAELEGLVGQMIEVGYLTADDVESLPRRRERLGCVVYAPLAEAPLEADVVLLKGGARSIMLVIEAAQAAGIGHDGAVMGRPTCAFIPVALDSGRLVTSLGCVGNRVYTDIADGDLYAALPAAELDGLLAALDRIVAANDFLEDFHRDRRRAAQS